MTIFFIVAIFILGYALITMEDHFKINKTATALLLSVVLWTIYVTNFTIDIDHVILQHVAEITEIILFLMGAMTIVELIDKHGGFNFVNNRITTRNMLALLWIVGGVTFFLSAILDNLTTAIVMIMVLRKLIAYKKLRWIFASVVIISANAGGAFSPIGDVTTIMLWIKGNITTMPTITKLFLPSLAAMLAPLIYLSFRLHKRSEVQGFRDRVEELVYPRIPRRAKITIFCIGVGGLMFVPVFRALTGLPPFVGILLALSVLWIYTEIVYHNRRKMDESTKQR
ncbi:MAG: sodium:proton antiporter NhaD, partial [Bacteroidales bacterium]|nr:sodium:proton antiporter NhaD [Bacteroidales bacterium]